MEVVRLLTVGLLPVLVFLAARRRRSRHATNTTRPMPTVEVGDPDVARRLIVGYADSFSNHSSAPLAVDLDAGHPRTESVNSAPYGPLWRALRSNLTANVLHPSRLGRLVVPDQRGAAEALVADLRSTTRRGGGVVVAVRDGVYAAVFATVARLCFGDGVGECDVRAMRRTLREFFHSDMDAWLLARSRLARLLHWRQWRYLVTTRRRLAELFGPVVAARRQSRLGDGGGGISSYVDSLVAPRPWRPQQQRRESRAPGNRRALRDDEVVRLVWEFLASGTEAVVACVEWTLARLVTKPEVQKKLQRELIAASDQRKGEVSDERLQDLPYLRAVILESLRLHPPLPMIVREVGPEGAAAAGAPPPPHGTLVRFLFNAEEIGRNPKAWTDPDEFRPERFLPGGEGEDVSLVPGPKEVKMMPFGAGRRHCPGVGLSMIHVGCFVAALVREFEWAPPADGGGVDLTATNALFLQVMASPLRARDGNGAPIPDPRWGFHPLGDTNRVILVPAGILTGQNKSPSGEPGLGTFYRSPSGDPRSQATRAKPM